MTEQPLGIGGSDINPTEEESALSQENIKQPEKKKIDYGDDPLGFERAAVNLVDWADNTFRGDKRSKEEIAENRQKIIKASKKSSDDYKKYVDEATWESDPFTTIAREVVRAPIGGIAGSVENLGEAGEFLGDTAKSVIAKTGIIKVDSKDIPWSQSYESAQWDLGTAKNNTAAGNFAREMISIVINMKQLAALGVGVGGGTTWQSRLASETLRGGLVDFFADPGEGNLSNIIADSRYSNLLSKALAHEDDDNQYIRRLKNLVEGGTIGIAVDGLSELYGALRAGKEAVKNGASADEAAKVAYREIEEIEPWDEGYVDQIIDFQNSLPIDGPGVVIPETPESIRKAIKSFKALPYQEKVKQFKRFTRSQQDHFGQHMPIHYWTDELDITQRSVRLDQGNSATWTFKKRALNRIEVEWEIDEKALKESQYFKQQELLKNPTPELLKVAKKQAEILGLKWDDLPDSTPRGEQQLFETKHNFLKFAIENSPGKGYKLPLKRLVTDWKTILKENNFREGTILEASPAGDGFGVNMRSDAQIRKNEIIKAKRDTLLKKLIDDKDELLYRKAKENAEAGLWNWDELPWDTGNSSVQMDKISLLQDASKGDLRLSYKTLSGDSGLSVRERIYRNMGFGSLDQDEMIRAVVIKGPNGLQLVPLNNPYRVYDSAFENAFNQYNDDFIAELQRNSADARKLENDLNSSTKDKRGKYEPYERGARRSTNDINDAATSQAERTDVDGGTQPFLNDADYDQLENVQDIAEYVEGIGAKINIDEIAGRLSEQPDDYVRKTLISVAKFASNGEISNLENLRFVDDRGIRSFGAGGTVAMDVIVKDTAEQLLDLSEELIELNDLSHFARDKTLAFITRTRALVKIKKEASIQSSFQLQNWKQIPPDVQRSLDEANIMIDETFEKIEKAFKGGNAEDMLEQKEVIQQFARAMVSTGGDPTKIGSFWGMVYKTGLKNINQAVINAWLSSPVSQIRNLAGNTVVALERPLAMAIGHALEGNWQGVRASVSMLDSMHSTLGESLAMARKSLGSETPVTKGSKLGEVFTNTTKDVDNLKRVATTPTEKFAAQTLGAYHSLVNMPWNTWPGRGLQSGDDLFKTMVSRMDLRYQAAIEVDKLRDLPNFAGDEKAFNDAYEKLLKKKIGANGEILDKELIENAQEATFQKELKGKMKRIADSLNAHDEMKQFIPFVRTPHNVNVYAFQHIPGLARFTEEWTHTMRYGTPQQKALMKGREAVGYLLVGTGGTLAMTGNMTGNGPADPELRKLWLKDHAPMSIKFGNTWVSYKSIPGAELIFSAIADTGQIMKYLNATDGDKLWGQLGYTIAASITDRSYFQGFVDLAGVLNIRGWTPEKVTRATSERLNLVFPITGGAGLRNQFENVLKSGMYEYRNSLHAVMGKMTGGILGDKIPTIDVLTGEQMVTGYENPVNAISPFKIAKKTASPLAKELSALQYEFSDAVVKKLHGVELNIEEQQEIRKLMYDNGNFPKALNAYLNSSQFKAQYKNWVDNQGTIDSVDRKQSKWYKDISTIVGGYRRKASTKFLNSGSDIADNFRSRIGQSNNPLETLLKVGR